MTIDMLKPLVEATVIDRKVLIRIENLKGKEVMKLIPIFKKLGKVVGISRIISECRKNKDRYVSFSFCG